MQLRTTRLVATLLIGAMAVTAIAPAAYAGHGRGNGHRKWKRSEVSYNHQGGSRYRNGYRVDTVSRNHNHGSSAGPVIAGIVGGFILGAAVANSSNRGYQNDGYYRNDGYQDRGYCPPPRQVASAGYYYYDPYCETRYSSMNASSGHFSHARHPQVVQVVETHTHQVVKRYTYEEGGWEPYTANYDPGYQDREYWGN